MMQPNIQKQHELFEDLTRFIKDSVSIVTDVEIPASVKEEIAETVIKKVINNWGGSLLYIPKNVPFQVSERKLEIFRRFNGTNHNELAREFKFAVQYIYRIVKEVGDAERKRTQLDIFDEIHK